MKKLITISILLILTSCQNWLNEEVKKTTKSKAASERINSSQENSKDVYKELDE